MIPLTDLKLNKFQSGLYIVATPIGNLSDITIRALEVLKISDYVLCEDTRVSGKLLGKFKIKANLISNHKFNEKKILNKIINLLEEGKIISLISDAGTPCISDPGGIIVRECIKKDIQIFSIPGADGSNLRIPQRIGVFGLLWGVGNCGFAGCEDGCARS